MPAFEQDGVFIFHGSAAEFMAMFGVEEAQDGSADPRYNITADDRANYEIEGVLEGRESVSTLNRKLAEHVYGGMARQSGLTALAALTVAVLAFAVEAMGVPTVPFAAAVPLGVAIVFGRRAYGFFQEMKGYQEADGRMKTTYRVNDFQPTMA